MGTLTISLDFELGWGAIESGLWRLRQQKGVYRDLRRALPRFLAHLDDLEIPLTWATVGAMVSTPTESDFDHLPASTRAATVAFMREADVTTQDGRDLFELVLGTRVAQDIGSHTFSHARWSLPDYGRGAKVEEMMKARSALSSYNLRPASFVYPLNHVSDLDVLSETGFSIARTAPPRPSSRPGKFMEMLAGYSPSSHLERQASGLATETGSLLYVWGTRWDSSIRRRVIARQVRRALALAARADHVIHLWLHPFNLAETPHLLEDSLGLLTRAAQLRDQGKMAIQTMRANSGG